MLEKAVRTLFCGKLWMELSTFKREMMELPPEDIFGCAYEVSVKVSIYENLLEMSHALSAEAMQTLISFPGILDYLYGRWLKTEDSCEKELQDCIWKSLTEVKMRKVTEDEMKKGA